MLEKRYATEEEKALLEPKKELVVGKWYWHESGCLNLVTSIGVGGDVFGYNITSKGEWIDYTNDDGANCLLNSVAKEHVKEATPQEVEKALIEEAKRRGFLTEGTKFISSISDKGMERVVSPYVSSYNFSVNPLVLKFINNELYYYEGINNKDGGCSNPRILKNGKWCNVIKNDDKSQVGDVCKFYDEDEDNFAIGILHSNDFSQLYPYEMKNANGYKNAKKLTPQEVIDLLFKK